MNSKTLILTSINESYVKILCEPGLAYELHDYFSFKVPNAHFNPLFKAKVWNGKIYLFNIKTGLIYKGLIKKVAEFCEERGYIWHYDNEDLYDMEFSVKEAEDFIQKLKPKFTPHQHQLDAFVHGIRMKRAVLVSPTASGKSFLIYLLSLYLLGKTFKKGLIIVPRVSLVTQLYKDFKDYSELNGWDVDSSCHMVYSGKPKETKSPLTITTWQSLQNMPAEFFEQFDFVVQDECHNTKAKVLTHIICSLVNAKVKLGVTGTLSNGEQVHELVVEGLFGPPKKIVDTSSLIQKKLLSDFEIKCLVLKYSQEDTKLVSKMTYQEEVNFLISNPRRNKFIENLALSLKGNTLVLFQFVEKHGEVLCKDLMKMDPSRQIYFVSGKVEAEVREEIRGIVEKSENAIIVASFGTYSEGINIRNLHNIIFASPSKARIRILQSIGRMLRIADQKTFATLYDIADDLRTKTRDNFTIKHFAERVKIYSEEKFKFKMYWIGVPENGTDKVP